MMELPPATFDYVCADLICPVCGEGIDDPCAIDLQTKLAREPLLRHLVVGDRLDILDDPQEAGYLRTGEALTPGLLRVIEAWSCPHCGASFLWARLIFEEGVLRRVEAADLSESSLLATDYVTAEALILVPLAEVSQTRALKPAALRARLAQIEIERAQS